MTTQCFHERFLTEYREEKFPGDHSFGGELLFCLNPLCMIELRSERSTDIDDYVHLVSHLPHGDILDTFTNLFSVPSPNQQSLRSRVIITHVGQDSGSGTWFCSKDQTVYCPHVTTARHFFQQVIRTDPAAQDTSITDMNTSLAYPRQFRPLYPPEIERLLM